MTIYLYKKTHNVTGLKYLGKTVSKNPSKYKGSGTKWRSHIIKYGYNVTTEILKECETPDELKYWGQYYSALWNIVESEDWANLIEEAGPGGLWSNESKSKLSNTKKKQLSLLTREERADRMKKSCSSPESWTADRIENMSRAMRGKKKTKTPALLEAERQRQNRTPEQKLKCGNYNRGKTWKLVDGKRIWVNKENQNY